MSDRDDLADVVFSVNGDHDALDAQAIADAVLMAGWRKMPSREQVVAFIQSRHRWAFDGGKPHSEVAQIIDAMLALMENGGTDER